MTDAEKLRQRLSDQLDRLIALRRVADDIFAQAIEATETALKTATVLLVKERKEKP